MACGWNSAVTGKKGRWKKGALQVLTTNCAYLLPSAIYKVNNVYDAITRYTQVNQKRKEDKEKKGGKEKKEKKNTSTRLKATPRRYRNQ